MKRLAIPLSILALATAVTTMPGCGSPYYAPAMDERGAPIVPQAVTYRPGFGWVENTMLMPSPMGGATGGTATGASGRLNRLAIRMDSGEIQYIDTDSHEFKKGTRVELTTG